MKKPNTIRRVLRNEIQNLKPHKGITPKVIKYLEAGLVEWLGW
jgi:hypothetical protein